MKLLNENYYCFEPVHRIIIREQQCIMGDNQHWPEGRTANPRIKLCQNLTFLAAKHTHMKTHTYTESLCQNFLLFLSHTISFPLSVLFLPPASLTLHILSCLSPPLTSFESQFLWISWNPSRACLGHISPQNQKNK